MQLVEAGNYMPSMICRRAFGFYMWRYISADTCSDVPYCYFLYEAIWRWVVERDEVGVAAEAKCR